MVSLRYVCTYCRVRASVLGYDLLFPLCCFFFSFILFCLLNDWAINSFSLGHRTQYSFLFFQKRILFFIFFYASLPFGCEFPSLFATISLHYFSQQHNTSTTSSIKCVCVWDSESKKIIIFMKFNSGILVLGLDCFFLWSKMEKKQ